MKLGCHAVLFRERIKNETETILKGLAATGFQGLEIGSRFFGTEDKSRLTDLLAQYQLELSGMHVGGVLKEWQDNEEEMAAKVLKVASFLKDMPNRNIVMSGNPFEGEADLPTIARNIEKVVQKCRDLGVRIHYHNHDWEFANNGAIFNALVEYAPSLYFGFDLGWVYVGGYNPFEIVKTYRSRITYVHLRDPQGAGKEFADLGRGIFDYPKLLKELQPVLANGWAVVEYEEGQQDFGRYTHAKAFLDRVMP